MTRLATLFGIVAALVLIGISAADDKPATQPEKLIVWDGDDVAAGGKWAEKDKCTVDITTEEFHSPKAALLFKGEGNQWLGFGYNWADWQDTNMTDASAYKNLTFWIKVKDESKLENLKVGLNSGPNTPEAKGEGVRVLVGDYCKDLYDNKWHEVTIPLKDLGGKDEYSTAKALDPAKVWEISFGTWAGDNTGKVTVWVDDIGFSK